MSLLAIIVLEATISCTALAGDACPQVYRLGGEAPLDEAVNVVFVSDGFAEAGIPDFRCAVGWMYHNLVSEPPFDRYPHIFNWYRMDLEASSVGIPPAPGCSVPCTETLPDWDDKTDDCARLISKGVFDDELYGSPVTPGADECAEFSIGNQFCRDGLCQLMYPDELPLAGAVELARRCVGEPAILIIVANSGVSAGGGRDGLAIATLSAIDTVETAHTLLSHELGHALLLQDEWIVDEGVEPPDVDFEPYRNVISLEEELTIDEQIIEPWRQGCADSSVSDPVFPDPNDPNAPHVPEECVAALIQEPCREVCNRLAPASAQGDGPDRCCMCRGAAPDFGFFEGAFYRPCGYFRAQRDCKMVSHGKPFCDVCVAYMSDLIESGQVHDIVGPPPTPGNVNRTDTYPD